MQRREKILICLAGWLAFELHGHAATQNSQANPYQWIVKRNVFALNMPPKPEAPGPESPTPIELQGIASIFDRQQALFTATMPGSWPGDSPKKVCLVLSVGERRGGVEVLKIDEITATVKFDNHGTIEWKSLEKDSGTFPTRTASASSR